MNILVIDDSRFISEVIKSYFPNDEVDHLYGIPDDLTILAKYDVLIVDNQGIGNQEYCDGSEFLRAYVPFSERQIVVYYSGLGASDDFKYNVLRPKGFDSYTKGRNPDGLVKLVADMSMRRISNRMVSIGH